MVWLSKYRLPPIPVTLVSSSKVCKAISSAEIPQGVGVVLAPSEHNLVVNLVTDVVSPVVDLALMVAGP